MKLTIKVVISLLSQAFASLLKSNDEKQELQAKYDLALQEISLLKAQLQSGIVVEAEPGDISQLSEITEKLDAFLNPVALVETSPTATA